MPSSLALIPLLMFPWSTPHGERHETRHIGAWTLKTRADAFSGQLACRLSAAHVDYGRGALTLHMSPRTDTSNALYRVDDGAAVSTRSETLEIARLGFAIYQDDLANPSGGLVRIPERRVMSAKKVAVEATPRGPVAVFKIGGLAAALDAAGKAGCSTPAYEIDPR